MVDSNGSTINKFFSTKALLSKESNVKKPTTTESPFSLDPFMGKTIYDL
jgi:hypothetical protein